MHGWRRASILSASLALSSAPIAQAQTPPASASAGRVSLAQTDSVIGNWRGTLKNAQGVDSPIIVTIAKKGDVYAGTTSLNATSEIPLRG